MKRTDSEQHSTTSNNLHAFIHVCLNAIAEKERGVPRVQAALTISSYGIAMGFLDSENEPEREILELALDLEVPDDAFEGDPEGAWQQLATLVRTTATQLQARA